MAVVWNIALCSLVDVSEELTDSVIRATRCSHLHIRRENLKFHLILMRFEQL